MAEQFNIHPDFQKVRGMELMSNPWLLKAINGAMHLAAAVKWSKYKNIVEQKNVIGLDGHRVPVWIIKPSQVQSPAPALVYCHGGAFILKHSPQHIENAIRYAQDANCCVIFVDYRLAPTHPFPAGFNDCYAVLQWAYQNAEKLGLDKQRIVIGGDSAGGAIAAGIAQKAAQRDGISLRGQLLIYPCADGDGKTLSGSAFADVPPFKKLQLKTVWETYFGHSLAQRAAEYASPIHGRFDKLAPAYVETSEFDPLCDEGEAYAQALIASGIDTELNSIKGTIHGFDVLVPDAALSREAMARRAQFLRKIFNS